MKFSRVLKLVFHRMWMNRTQIFSLDPHLVSDEAETEQVYTQILERTVLAGPLGVIST